MLWRSLLCDVDIGRKPIDGDESLVETSAVELKGEAGDDDRDDVDEADVDLMEHERRIEILQAMLEDASSAAERAQRGVGAIQGPSRFVARSLRKGQPRHRARLRSCIEKIVLESRLREELLRTGSLRFLK